MALGKNTIQVAIILKKEVEADLRLYALSHHWSRSQAAALLIEAGLQAWKQQQGKEGQPSDEIL